MSAELLGVLAAGAYFLRLVPQPVRLWRTGVPDGVSPMAVWNTVVTDFGWLLYGLLSGVVAVWVTAAVSLPLALWASVMLVRRARRSDAAGTAVWLAVVVGAWAGGVLGSVLAVSVMVNHGPQVWKALRETDLAGIAPMTYVFALLDASLWGAYGIVLGDAALVGYGTVLLAVAVTILARLWWTRRRPAPLPALALAEA